MRILLVGALSWNPDRFRTLHEQGHRLWGMWARSMAWDQAPYPMLDDCIVTVSPEDAPALLAREQIDCVYALFQVYDRELWGPATPGVEHDVWTLLRGLFDARARGEFDAPIVFHWGFDVHHLDEAVVAALDGRIFCNREQHRFWTTPRADGGAGFECFTGDAVTGFLDSDLPKAEFATDDFTPPLSEGGDDLHTVCIGRPFHLDYVALARHGIHVHVYGNGYDETIDTVADDLLRRDADRDVDLVARFLHVHASLQTTGRTWDEVRAVKATWVHEFSRYDAGWSYLDLPFPWKPLEDRAAIPNRLSTYLLAGLPVITDVRPGAYRYDTLVRHGVAVELADDDHGALAATLRDAAGMQARRERARAARHQYTFDATLPALLALLEETRAQYLARDRAERRRAPAAPTGGPKPASKLDHDATPSRRARAAVAARGVAGRVVGPVRRRRDAARLEALRERLRAGTGG